VRFTADEYAELAAAATRTGLTTTGYVGEAALAAARGVNATGEVDTGAITRAELAALQRDLFAARTAVNQAAAELRGTPAGSGGEDAIGACGRSVAALDAVVASQPFWLFWPAGEDKVRSHVPDYFARLADGSALVVDCRPVERIKPKDMAAFEATRTACEHVGWR
jgi:hypothetical protein